MGSIAEIILRFLELLEAEARAFRLALARLLTALVMLGIVGVLALTGLGLIVWAIYLYLRLGLNAPTSALLDGLITITLAGVVVWSARRIVR